MHDLDAPTTSVKKLANGALVIESRQRPKRNQSSLLSDRQVVITSKYANADILGVDLPGRRGQSQLESINP